MKCRISSEHFQILQNLVLKPLWREGAKVYIFGSRSQGTHHPYSDVDLIFKSEKEVPQILISKIKEDIEESSFPDALMRLILFLRKTLSSPTVRPYFRK